MEVEAKVVLGFRKWLDAVKGFYWMEQWSFWVSSLVVGWAVGGVLGVVIGLMLLEGMLFVMYGRRPYANRWGKLGVVVEIEGKLQLGEERMVVECEQMRKEVEWGEIMGIEERRGGVEIYVTNMLCVVVERGREEYGAVVKLLRERYPGRIKGRFLKVEPLGLLGYEVMEWVGFVMGVAFVFLCGFILREIGWDVLRLMVGFVRCLMEGRVSWE